MHVYITALASFLPNAPVGNEEMEALLGKVHNLPSRTRRIILRNNRIKTRYYALDPDTGTQTHTNAQLAAAAIRALGTDNGFDPASIECLCCGTSTPDQILPGHAPMVHGELGGGPCEAFSAAGICTSGMSAMKFAWLNVASGQSRTVIASGSELASNLLHARMCESIAPEKVAALDKNPALSFDADFLRWMLSDGAGAAHLSDAPNPEGLSLRIEWIDLLSFAHELEPCMYVGANKRTDGTLQGWREFDSLQTAVESGCFTLKQDVKLLNKEVIYTAVERTLTRLIEKHHLRADEIDWFLPHYSSDYFRSELHNHMLDIGFDIPYERWFTNLTTRGNTGSASIYIIMEELFHSGRIKKGDKLLCFIPESGRFSMCYMLLTAV
ncbi:MAG: beta-ketoacyl-ACP synthase III [Geobacteraceae bacterium]|nr:beta-ketoacyl-ACP synthase III [Geobacteraceae bacterium]